MKNLYMALAIALCSAAYSQTDYTFIYDGNNFIEQGIARHDNEKYTEAVKFYEKVAKNDPQFYRAQYEKGMSLAAMENKDAAKAFFEEALAKGYMKEMPEMYMSYGNLLSDLKEYDKAEKMLLEAQKGHPDSSLLLYNMGVLYLRMENRQKAVDLLEQAITLNPGHPASHYLLGLMALEDGRVTEGTMALLAYLTLAPNGGGAENAILKLNAKFAENYLDKPKLNFSRAGGDNFEEIDVILRNSLPLKKAYKVESSIDDVITRQVQAVVQYAAEHKVQNGFFETTYVPWLADVVRKKQFEPFSYYILLGMEEKLGKTLTSQKKKILQYSDTYIKNDYWAVFGRRKMNHFGKEEEVMVYLQDNKPYLIGKVVNGKKEGKFRLLDEYGHLVGELSLANDELEGLCKYYNREGKLTEEKSFSKGELDGKKTKYYDNGNPETIENYKAGKLSGISASYYVNGGKACEGNFVNDERDGEFTCYFENGKKKNVVGYSNGKLNGKAITYNESGDTITESSYVMDERDGKAAEYYDGKALKSETVYKAGKIAAPYREYYPNGTLKEETLYVNDIRKSSISYTASGKKEYETLYDKDGDVAAYNYYDANGNKFYEETYKKDGLKSALQYESGKPKPTEISLNKEAFVMKSFDGAIITKGKYDKGQRVGEWVYYNSNGNLSAKKKFEKGFQAGLDHAYDHHGRISRITHFVQDTIAGVYETYDDGKLTGTYHYSKGKANGPAVTYNADGSIATESFYIDGERYAKVYTYWQSGKLNFVSKYEDGTIVTTEYFDVQGNKEGEVNYTNKTGKSITSYSHGNEVHEYNMANGQLDGLYTVKDKNGRLLYQTTYADGYRSGKYIKNGPTGAPHYDYNYYNGKLHGIANFYDLVGNLRRTDNYVFGDETGMGTRFFNNKAKAVEVMQYDGENEGEEKYYNMQGEQLLVIGYSEGAPIYYALPGKDSKFSDKISIKAQTAKIVAAYANGKPAIELNFTKGALDGKYAVYGADGKPQYECSYDNGLLNGPRKEYYANGKVYKKENFKDNNFDGLQEFYKEDGALWLSAEYKNDDLNGLCKIYANGAPAQILKYDSDKLVEIVK